MDFKGKVVLVTGASRGIGAALARAFAGEGATVVVNYLRSADAARAVAADCEARGGGAVAVRADVTSEAEARALVDRAVAEAGRIDAVVNNAFRPYVFDPDNRKPFRDTGWEDYAAQFEGAVGAARNVCAAALPEFERRARGSIVNVATDLIERPSIPYHAYTTAKAALAAFSRNLAAELGPLGVRVNCVAPGLVYPTGSSRETPEGVLESLAAQTPLRRVATPEDVCGPVLFLASDWSRFVTGQTLHVDGGLVMR